MSYIRVVLYKSSLVSYIRLILIATGFAYHNFTFHTIRVSPSAFLFVLCSNCFHGGYVKHAGIVANTLTLDGVIFICHNIGFYLLTL